MKIVKDLPLNISLFLILALVITLTFGLIYVCIQQVYRQSANDPQIQISEDMANYLSAGKDVKQVMPPTDVDISKSLVWFLTVYDDAGTVIASNAKLDGQTPTLPSGVLDHAKNNGQNRVTWEPKEGVRVATVITRYEGGYVLVGRSLRETDNRIGMLHKKIAMVWLITLVATFLGTWYFIPRLKKSH